MKRPLYTLAACAALGIILGSFGCAPRYSHPNKPESFWEKDYNLCVVEADYAVEFHHYSTTASRPLVTQFDYYSPRYYEFIERCMEEKGYSYEDDPRELLFGDGKES